MLNDIILGFLLHGDMSGYDIRQFMKFSMAYFYDASFGSIYPMLNKLEADGAISVREVVDGGKYKKVYSITDAGRAAFFRWLAEPIELHRGRQDHLVRLFFFEFLPQPQVQELLAGFIRSLEEELADLERLEQIICCQAGMFPRATLEYGKGYYEFTVQWYRGLLDRLKAGTAQPVGPEQ